MPAPGGVAQNVDDRWPPYRLAYTTVEINLNITKFNMEKVSN